MQLTVRRGLKQVEAYAGAMCGSSSSHAGPARTLKDGVQICRHLGGGDDGMRCASARVKTTKGFIYKAVVASTCP